MIVNVVIATRLSNEDLFAISDYQRIRLLTGRRLPPSTTVYHPRGIRMEMDVRASVPLATTRVISILIILRQLCDRFDTEFRTNSEKKPRMFCKYDRNVRVRLKYLLARVEISFPPIFLPVKHLISCKSRDRSWISK